MRRPGKAACLFFMGAVALAQDQALDALRAAGGGVGGGTPDGVTRVLVLDAVTKRPVAGAVVRAGVNGPQSVTDANGRVDLAANGPITASAGGYGPTTIGAFPARLVAVPLWPSRTQKGGIPRLSRDVLAGSIVPSSIEAWSASTSSFLRGGVTGEDADRALGNLRAVTGALIPPQGLSAVNAIAGALLARVPGLDTPAQVGGGRMQGLSAPSFRMVAPAAADASDWSAVVLLRGAAGFSVGRWGFVGSPPFAFPAPLDLPVVPAIVADAAALRWNGVPSGAAMTTISMELSDGRVWNVFLPAGESRFDVPGGMPSAFRWTVSHHRFAAFDGDSWTMDGLEPVASSFSVPALVGNGRFDARLTRSPLGAIYALPETGMFVFESKGRDPWFLTY